MCDACFIVAGQEMEPLDGGDGPGDKRPVDRVHRHALGPFAHGQIGQLTVGGVADVCVLTEQGHWTVTAQALRSQGKSTPFSGYELPGRVLTTLVAGHVAFEV